MKCKVVDLLTDAEGALYKGDIVTIVEWTEIGQSDDTVVVFVVDDIGKHHTVGLKQIQPL